jgi:uncharacterized protein (TIGR01568 family)
MEKEENNVAMNDEPVSSKKQHARLQRSFSHICKALIKKLHGGGHAANTNDKSSPSSSSRSFLSGCMHPRTNSFVSNRRRHQATVKNGGCELDDDDGALAVGFRSIRLGAASDEGGSSSSSQDYYTDDGMSEEEGECAPPVAGGGVAMVTFSAAPYVDFRRSMREMVDAAARGEEAEGSAAPAVDWDLMEELLFRYLELNDRAVHKDILRAFTDTVAALRRRRRRAVPSAAKARRTRPRRCQGG